MQAALAQVTAHLGHEYDLVIGGRRLRTEDKIVSINPARPAQVVGIHQMAEAGHVDAAVRAAHKAFTTWSRTSVADRVHLLLRTATLLRERNFEFCA
jgi:1-pyrroline-5-carboxylate dehydrogenase